MNFRATLWKTIRILGISLALVVLLVFSTGVVSDWNHHSASDDANCPYCHRRAIRDIAEAGRFLAAAARRSSAHGPCLFADRTPRTSCRINKKLSVRFIQ
jgi:hypothetical protein